MKKVCIAVLSMSVFVTSVWSMSNDELRKQLKLFTEVLSYVNVNYVEAPEAQELMHGAIKGMLSELDPHSSFMKPETYKEFRTETKGEFGGLGIQIAIKDKVLTVIAPIEDTPADRVGILAGDKIVRIDGATTEGMSVMDAVKILRGAPGSKVTITVWREGFSKVRDFEIIRDIIRVKSVKATRHGNLGHVKVTNFKENTTQELLDALGQIDDQKLDGIVLDLRNNPGGLLNQASDLASIFLPENKLVVYTEGRTAARSDLYSRKIIDKPRSYPMVVLVNGGSASASEIVAGAFQDHKRSLVLGTQTFGKASVQTVIPLSDGSGIRLTTARYYTPFGRSIQGVGITPDIIVKQGKIVSSDEAMDSVKEADLPGHLIGEAENGQGIEGSDTGEAYSNDLQLQRAFDILKAIQLLKGNQALSAVVR
ncbi:S41 family peptidase [Chrysiogenes arsenatis]|uniref:S41 family peptidase n=1 Tax=Chrysiogenes arsenatis TaxID=309797 RepID=UPI0004067F08|nr:S41 family peptidase [Chrysiogenes arsenatis]